MTVTRRVARPLTGYLHPTPTAMMTPRFLSPLGPRRRRLPNDLTSLPREGRSAIRFRTKLTRVAIN